jgi:hypothetical protein
VASDIVGRTATLRQTKNRTKRGVPLSLRAAELLLLLPDVPDGEPLFHMSPESLDALFRKARKRAMIDDGTFYDAPLGNHTPSEEAERTRPCTHGWASRLPPTAGLLQQKYRNHGKQTRLVRLG